MIGTLATAYNSESKKPPNIVNRVHSFLRYMYGVNILLILHKSLSFLLLCIVFMYCFIVFYCNFSAALRVLINERMN